MTAAPDEPNWSALPHEPQRFFELPEGFDRIDLRRKYSALIRRFKPEKFPEEFQRIRAAFEDLDQQLRATKQPLQSARPVPHIQVPDVEMLQLSARESCSAESPEELEQSLRGLAHQLRNDQFYREASTIWLQLIAVTPFKRWQRLLDELSEIVDTDDYDQPPVEKVEFYIRFLRRALWVAHDHWLEKAFAFLDDNADLVREPWEHEMLLRLDEYRDDRQDFLDGTRGRQLIDDAILDYCVKPDVEALEAFRHHQTELATHPEWLRESFPVGNDDMWSHWELWSWISNEVCERLKPRRSIAARPVSSINSMLSAVAEVTRTSPEFIRWRRIAVFDQLLRSGLLHLLGTVTACLLIISCTAPSVLWKVFPFWLVIAGVMIRRVSYRLVNDGKSEIDRNDPPRGNQIAQACYEKYWASLIDQYVHQTGTSFEELIEQLRVDAAEKVGATLDDGNPFVRWIHHFAATDYALACFSLAQQFVR